MIVIGCVSWFSLISGLLMYISLCLGLKLGGVCVYCLGSHYLISDGKICIMFNHYCKLVLSVLHVCFAI